MTPDFYDYLSPPAILSQAAENRKWIECVNAIRKDAPVVVGC
jgi:hypothetical protein